MIKGNFNISFIHKYKQIFPGTNIKFSFDDLNILLISLGWVTMVLTRIINLGGKPSSLPYWINALPLQHIPEQLVAVFSIQVFRIITCTPVRSVFIRIVLCLTYLNARLLWKLHFKSCSNFDLIIMAEKYGCFLFFHAETLVKSLQN